MGQVLRRIGGRSSAQGHLPDRRRAPGLADESLEPDTRAGPRPKGHQELPLRNRLRNRRRAGVVTPNERPTLDVQAGAAALDEDIPRVLRMLEAPSIEAVGWVRPNK